jgi:hypothetical protein
MYAFMKERRVYVEQKKAEQLSTVIFTNLLVFFDGLKISTSLFYKKTFSFLLRHFFGLCGLKFEHNAFMENFIIMK